MKNIVWAETVYRNSMAKVGIETTFVGSMEDFTKARDNAKAYNEGLGWQKIVVRRV